jgi:hypothetical protein
MAERRRADRWTVLLAGLVAAVTFSVGPAAQRRAAPVDLTAEGVVRTAATYLTEYQKAFSYIVADETYIQRLEFNDLPAQTRRITGELFMTYLPVDEEWITVRDVATVDGRPVEAGENLRALLQTSGYSEVVERVANHNARFNIGTIIRNFNEPTLPLLILDPRRKDRIRFKRTAMEGDGDATMVTVEFEEKDRPTVVSSAAGGPVYSKGALVIEAATGRVRQTQFEHKDGRVTARLVTTYSPDEKLDLWVPARFEERYELEQRSGRRETVYGEATYTNYRKFVVTGRIKR